MTEEGEPHDLALPGVLQLVDGGHEVESDVVRGFLGLPAGDGGHGFAQAADKTIAPADLEAALLEESPGGLDRRVDDLHPPVPADARPLEVAAVIPPRPQSLAQDVKRLAPPLVPELRL